MNMHGSGETKTMDSEKSLSVFTWVDVQHKFLTDTYDQLLITPDRKHISRCLYLGHKIQHACQNHAMGVVAALQLNRNARYQHVKELYAAVLCELIGRRAGMTSSARLLLICAALTQDIGMLDLQDDRLDKQATGLTDPQRRQIQKHSLNGLKILDQAGVKDAVWLSAVEQHHERLDGKGYPQALSGDQISQAARILSLADIYVAMARPRGDRPALLPREAMKQIFQSRGEQVDADLAKLLIAILGTQPPGSWVRLANNEIAVVVRRSKVPAFPIVGAVLSGDGEHLEQAVLRETSDRTYTMVEMVKAPFHFNLSALLSQLWPKLSD
ncbi:MAG: HD domain-containing phosphohydrolase [Halopseudomonas sp.]